jgi:hypothetical protein
MSSRRTLAPLVRDVLRVYGVSAVLRTGMCSRGLMLRCPQQFARPCIHERAERAGTKQTKTTVYMLQRTGSGSDSPDAYKLCVSRKARPGRRWALCFRYGALRSITRVVCLLVWSLR